MENRENRFMEIRYWKNKSLARILCLDTVEMHRIYLRDGESQIYFAFYLMKWTEIYGTAGF